MTPGKATSTSSAIPSPSRFRRPTRAGLAEAAAVGAILAAAGLVYARSLDQAANYDEGVYLATLDALRHGQIFGSDVFPDQPPGFYLLLRLAAWLFGNSVHGVRTGMLLVALVGCVGAYALGRRLDGRGAGIAAAALVAFTPPLPTFAPLVEADPPAVTLALVAVALAAWAYGRPQRPALGALAGAAFMLALSIKLLAVSAAVPIAAFMVAGRASRRAVVATAAGAVVVVCAFLLAYAGVLGGIWEGNVTVHRYARSLGGGYVYNLRRILHFPDLHTPFAWLLFAAVVVGSLAWLRGRRGGLWPLWLWALASVGFLVYEQPLLDHHLVLLGASLAPPVAVTLAREIGAARTGVALAGAAALAALVLAAAVQEHRRLDRNAAPEPSEIRWGATELRRFVPSGQLVATDLPIVAYLGDRRIPGQLIDTSRGRLGSHYLPPAELLRLVDESRVRAVVVARLFNDYPEIFHGLRRRFPCTRTKGFVSLYLRCRAP